MKTTEHYHLSIKEEKDPVHRQTFNEDNEKIDAALAAMAEKSAVTAVETALANYQTSNDAAVASATAKANAAYSASNSPFSFVTVDTTGMGNGETVYTFTKAPKFIILQGTYSNAVLKSGATVKLVDALVPSVSSAASFQLSSKTLTLVGRNDSTVATALTILVHY